MAGRLRQIAKLAARRGRVPTINDADASSLLLGGAPSEAGSVVSEGAAMALPAVNRAVRVRTDLLAGLLPSALSPTGLALRVPIIGGQVAPSMSWHEMLSAVQHDRLLWGSGYAICERSRNGTIESISPVPREQAFVQLKVMRNSRGLVSDWAYDVRWYDERGSTEVLGEDMLHVRGDRWNGEEALSVIGEFREALGTMISTERFGARQMGRGILRDTYLAIKGPVDPDTAERYAKTLLRQIAGINSSHGVAVFGDDATLKHMNMSAKDAEFLLNRRWQSGAQVAQMMQVPPGLIGLITASGQAVGVTVNEWQVFVRTAIGPDAQKWSDALARVFNRVAEVDFGVDRLIRLADERQLASAAQMWRKASIKSINEIRHQQDMAPFDDPRADDPFYQMGGEGGRDEGVRDGNDDGMDGITAPDAGVPVLDPDQIDDATAE